MADAKITKWLLFTYFTLSGITWVAGDSASSITGRLAIADLWLLVLGAYALRSNRSRWIVPRTLPLLLLMLGTLVASLINSPDLRSSFLELSIHIFLATGFLIIFSLVAPLAPDDRFSVLILWIRASGLLAVVALYDFLAPNVGLPSLPRPASFQGLDYALTGTFRNSGQAGAFFMTSYVLSLAATLAAYQKQARELRGWAITLALALALTSKRAAIISAAFGTLAILLTNSTWRRHPKLMALILTGGIAVWGTYQALMEYSPSFRWRIEYKAQTASQVFDRDAFWGNNLKAAWEAFSDHPFLGTGLGGVAGEYTETHEIHSTYGSVAAQGGVLGVFCYLIFVGSLVWSTWRKDSPSPQVKRLSQFALAIWLALLLSYVYTYHFRKREFWITAALLSAITAPIPRRLSGSTPSCSLSHERNGNVYT